MGALPSASASPPHQLGLHGIIAPAATRLGLTLALSSTTCQPSSGRLLLPKVSGRRLRTLDEQSA
jgi:hypothetical protein